MNFQASISSRSYRFHKYWTSEKRCWNALLAFSLTLSVIGLVKLISSISSSSKSERKECNRCAYGKDSSPHLEFKIVRRKSIRCTVRMDEQKERRGEREEGRGEAGNSATIDLLIIRQLLTVFPCELRKYIASFREDRTTFDEIPFENVRLMYDTFVFEDTRAH